MTCLPCRCELLPSEELIHNQAQNRSEAQFATLNFNGDIYHIDFSIFTGNFLDVSCNGIGKYSSQSNRDLLRHFFTRPRKLLTLKKITRVLNNNNQSQANKQHAQQSDNSGFLY